MKPIPKAIKRKGDESAPILVFSWCKYIYWSPTEKISSDFYLKNKELFIIIEE